MSRGSEGCWAARFRLPATVACNPKPDFDRRWAESPELSSGGGELLLAGRPTQQRLIWTVRLSGKPFGKRAAHSTRLAAEDEALDSVQQSPWRAGGVAQQAPGLWILRNRAGQRA